MFVRIWGCTNVVAVSRVRSAALVVESAVEFVLLRVAIVHPAKKNERGCTRDVSRARERSVTAVKFCITLSLTDDCDYAEPEPSQKDSESQYKCTHLGEKVPN